MCDEKEDPRVGREVLGDPDFRERNQQPFPGMATGGYPGDASLNKNPIPRNQRSMGLLDRLESEVQKAVTAKDMEEKEINQQVEFYMRLDYNELCAHIKKTHVSLKRDTFQFDCMNKALGKKLGI